MREQTRLRCLAIAIVVAGVAGARPAHAADGLSGKMIVGYQGWFGCPNDFEGNKEWQHWFIKGVEPRHIRVDLLPSERSLDAKDLCDTGLARADGNGTIKLFSSQNPAIVNAHFRWMLEAGIDGAAPQRFVGTLVDSVKLRRYDHVLSNIRIAAENNKRVFFVLYDVSGADARTVVDDIRADWRHLVNDLKLLDSAAYLRDRGKPVLEIWGFGFANRPGEPQEVAALIQDLRLGQNGLAAVTLIGGVPTHWRTLEDDSKPDADWAKIYRSFDVVSPWSVGRFSDEKGATAFAGNVVARDLEETRRLGIGYLPVMFPGFSWYNLQTNRHMPEHAVLNQIRRRCGQFLWGQVTGLLAQHVDMIYAAMFDELDEGTALLPAVTRQDRLPAGSRMVYLNQDGCALPDDWYLRVTGKAAEYLRSGQVPPRKLSDVLKP